MVDCGVEMNFMMWISTLLMLFNLVCALGAYMDNKGPWNWGLSLVLAALMGLCLYLERNILLRERKAKEEFQEFDALLKSVRNGGSREQ